MRSMTRAAASPANTAIPKEGARTSATTVSVRGEWHLVCLALNIKRMRGLVAC